MSTKPGQLHIVRTEHLKDYLAARNMGLQTASFFERDEILEDATHIDWPEGTRVDEIPTGSWEGRVMPIHRGGGEPFGSSMHVMHVWNDSADASDDAPKFDLPASQAVSSSWNIQAVGDKVYRVLGELWRDEWIAPAEFSPRVRGDKPPPTSFFITDGSGKTESRLTLSQKGQWLWFRPDVVNTLLQYRDGLLSWCSRDTGRTGFDENSTVHFGLNDVGLLTVYAKDIGQLDDWQQKVWAAHNVTPDGRVSAELWKAQMKAEPARTRAPESFVRRALDTVNRMMQSHHGTAAFREHADMNGIIASCHRFRAVQPSGILSLAKDLARLSADAINAKGLHAVLKGSGTQDLKSLKVLQAVVALSVGEEKACGVMAPLFGIYDLRLADAHLASRDLSDVFSRASVDTNRPLPEQGFQLLDSFVATLYEVAAILRDAPHN